MSTISRITSVALGAILVLGGAAAPAVADQAARSGDPDVVTTQLTPQQELRAAARAARLQYARAVAEARSVRRAALAVARAKLRTALAKADRKAERRSARRAFAKAAAPIRAEYRASRRAAAATRDAALDEALADYLVATGKPALTEALKAYQTSTKMARDTLALALKSGTATFRTDTADERALLLADLEAADTEAQRVAAWRKFVAETADERAAHQTSIAAARSAYQSAMVRARTAFVATTGISITSLLKLPFRV